MNRTEQRQKHWSANKIKNAHSLVQRSTANINEPNNILLALMLISAPLHNFRHEEYFSRELLFAHHLFT